MLGIIILLLFILLIIYYKVKKENFVSNEEAIQNIASLYNDSSNK